MWPEFIFSKVLFCSVLFQVTVLYNHAIFVAVTLECLVKRFICKTWTWILANSVDPDQMPQNVASDQGLHSLLKLQEVMGLMKQF